MANKLLENLHFIKPYMVRLCESVLHQGESCLGCDKRMPLLDNELCADCDTPGLALNTFRVTKGLPAVIMKERS